ncbi:MAG: hypothetical protein ACI9SC_001776, partial [Gammaproteobacteria bacterium]
RWNKCLVRYSAWVFPDNRAAIDAVSTSRVGRVLADQKNFPIASSASKTARQQHYHVIGIAANSIPVSAK